MPSPVLRMRSEWNAQLITVKCRPLQSSRFSGRRGDQFGGGGEHARHLLTVRRPAGTPSINDERKLGAIPDQELAMRAKRG